MNTKNALDLVLHSFFMMLEFILFLAIVYSISLIREKIMEKKSAQKNKIKEDEKYFFREKEVLKTAIIENTRNLERVWSDKGLGKDLEEGIKKEQERLRASL